MVAYLLFVLTRWLLCGVCWLLAYDFVDLLVVFAFVFAWISIGFWVFAGELWVMFIVLVVVVLAKLLVGVRFYCFGVYGCWFLLFIAYPSCLLDFFYVCCLFAFVLLIISCFSLCV